MLLAAALVSIACESSIPWLGDAFLACDEIEIARVEAIERIEGLPDVSLAKLRIERSLWVADCEDVRTVLVHDGWDASPTPLEVGDRSIWFLVIGNYRQDEWDREAWKAVHGLWCERVICRLPIAASVSDETVFLPNQDWHSLDRPPDDDRRGFLPLRAFEGLLGNEILNRTPRIESSGGFTIESDGNVSWKPWSEWRNRHTALSPEEMRSVLGAMDRERFFDLPKAVGVDCCPDVTTFFLALRTTEGRHGVCLRGPPDPKSGRDAAAYLRIMRVWDAIPQRLIPRPTGRWPR